MIDMHPSHRLPRSFAAAIGTGHMAPGDMIEDEHAVGADRVLQQGLGFGVRGVANLAVVEEVLARKALRRRTTAKPASSSDRPDKRGRALRIATWCVCATVLAARYAGGRGS